MSELLNPIAEATKAWFVFEGKMKQRGVRLEVGTYMAFIEGFNAGVDRFNDFEPTEADWIPPEREAIDRMAQNAIDATAIGETIDMEKALGEQQ